MINSVIITNHLDESITMELRFPEKSGFLIQSIIGLNPSKANINISEISGNDGSIFSSSRINSRNIVFSLLFKNKPTIEDMRQKSYKYFPIKQRIAMIFETDTRSCETYGYVESNEINIFSREEGSIISVICPDPYLYDRTLQITQFASVESLFEFPFSNESLTDPLLFFSNMILGTMKTVNYAGDLEVGIIISIHALGSASNIEISNVGTSESIFIDSVKIEYLTGSGIVEGDDIYISTVKGNKYAILVRSGVTYNIINSLGQHPDWFEIVKGDNVFSYTAETGLTNLQFIITNRTAYEGI